MLHDEKVTVPVAMYTPPPCKHKRKTCENPIGAMGNCRSLRHVPTVVDRSVSRSCVRENQSKRVSNFPIGAMGTFEREHAHIQLCCQ